MIEGKVFSVQGNDTIQLNSVLVKVIIDQLDSTGLNYDNKYKTRTDSLGKYLIEISYVPYIANYTVVFSKPGYNILTFRKRLRRSKNISFFAQLTRMSEQGDENKIVGSFDTRISYSDPNPNIIIFSIFFFFIFIFLAIRYNIYQVLNDFYQRITDKEFKQLKESKQRAILEQAFCSNCLAYNGMSVDREEHIQGMVWLHGKCANCDNKVKVRWK